MGVLRVHLLFTDGEDIVHSAKLKSENYNLDDFEDTDLNELERKVIHELRIAQEEVDELNWRGGKDDA